MQMVVPQNCAEGTNGLGNTGIFKLFYISLYKMNYSTMKYKIIFHFYV